MSLTLNNFTQLENFGHSLRAPSYRIQTNGEEIFEVFQPCKETWTDRHCARRRAQL